MKKITIGLFNDSFPPMIDGVGMVVDNYARRLTKYCNVIVFVPGYKQKYDDSKLPYKVVRCKSIKIPFLDYSLPLPWLDRKFKKELKKSNLDLVHIHSPFSIGKYALKYAKKRNVPSIGTMHSQFHQDFKRATRSNLLTKILTKSIVKVFNKCSKCYAVNSGMANLYYHEYGVKEMPGVLNNATEMKLLKNKTKQINKINALHNIEKDEKVFLFVGRINKLKNIFFIVDSLYILNKKKPKYKYKMLFVGNGQDLEELKEYIKKKNMQDYIILCGKVSNREELINYYARSDLFLFPSLYDASSIVQIEAASQKVPTIFLKGSKTSSDITNYHNGFIASSIEEFASIIDKMMTDNKLYKEISNNVYKEIYKSWDNVVEDVYKIYLEYIEKR